MGTSTVQIRFGVQFKLRSIRDWGLLLVLQISLEPALCRLIWAQVHCRDRNQVHLGVRAADQLLTLKADKEQELLYLKAVGQYKLGKLSDARSSLQQSLKSNANFTQGKNLLRVVEDKLTNDTLVAGGAIAGVVGISAAVTAVLLAGGSSKR